MPRYPLTPNIRASINALVDALQNIPSVLDPVLGSSVRRPSAVCYSRARERRLAIVPGETERRGARWEEVVSAQVSGMRHALIGLEHDIGVSKGGGEAGE